MFQEPSSTSSSDGDFATLVASLRDGDAGVREAATLALYLYGPDAVASLVEALHDPEPGVRYGAAQTLGEMGRDAAPAIPALLLALHDGDVCKSATWALQEVHPQARPEGNELIAATSSPSAESEGARTLHREPLSLPTTRDPADGAINQALWRRTLQAVARPSDTFTAPTLDIHVHPHFVSQKAAIARLMGAVEGDAAPSAPHYWVVMTLRETAGGQLPRYFEGPLRLDVLDRYGPSERGDYRYGERLFASLIHDALPENDLRLTRGEAGRATLRAGFLCALAATRGEEKVRIQLRIDTGAVRLHHFPWECLWDAHGSIDEPLACYDRTPFSRVLQVSGPDLRSTPSLSASNPLRILVAAASPAALNADGDGPSRQALRGLRPIEPDEVHALVQGLARLPLVARVASAALLDGTNEPVTLAALENRLETAWREDAGQHPFHVVHLLCHGVIGETGTSYLVLEGGSDGDAALVPEAAVAEALRPYVVRGLRLVVLASCFTARPELWRRRRRSPRDHAPGRVQPDEWGVPVLFMRVADGRLFTLDENARDLTDPEGTTEAVPFAFPVAHLETPLRVFDTPGQEMQRQHLLTAAAAYRRQPARRTVLVLRKHARQEIVRLLDPQRLKACAAIPGDAALQAALAGDFATFVCSKGKVVCGATEVSDFVRACLDPGGPLAGFTTKAWRRMLDARPVPTAGSSTDDTGGSITGNLTWTCPSVEDPAPPLDALRYLLCEPGDAFQHFETVTDAHPEAGGLDEHTASLVLHAFHPDRFVPYHQAFARKVARRLPRYGRGDAAFRDFCGLSGALLADDDLGFDDLADVFFFLQLLAEDPAWPAQAPPRQQDLSWPVRTPLPSLRTVTLPADTGLTLDEGVVEQACAALTAGKHIILMGPPGTGKTSLAEDLCRWARDGDCNRGHQLVTATADWTTFDTMGGYMPAPGGQLTFQPGLFLKAIAAAKWLIIDEINRADIDKAFGELFTVLSGQAVGLPYVQQGRPVRILPSGRPPSAHACDYVMPASWRIIGTMNVFDQASLFSLSKAFMRRFAFIDVGLPRRSAYERFVQASLSAYAWPEDPDGVLDTLGILLGQQADNALTRWRAPGPAIIQDVVRYLHERSRERAALTTTYLAEALLLFVIPQFDGLEEASVCEVYQFLARVFAGQERERLRLRIQALFPYLSPASLDGDL